MPFNAPIISQLRLGRIHRWAMLWLRWFAAFLEAAGAFAPLSAQAQAIAHRWLDNIEEALIWIVLLRAIPRMRPAGAPKHPDRRRNDSQLVRAFVGSAMRKALRARDLRRRIEALSQDIDALVVRLVKRLARGLTRRRPILARRETRQAALSRGLVLTPRCADTS